MPQPSIRLLTVEDLDAAFALSSTAGWNQRLEDWRMLLSLAPRGSFAALDGNRIVGTSIGIDYEGFGWIAMMLVDPSVRGRGLGRRLLEAALGAVPAERPVRLDATPMGRPLYERYGFEPESMLTRYVADGSTSRILPDKASGDLTHLTAANLGPVEKYDRAIFGGSRRAVLEWTLAQAPEYAYVADAQRSAPRYCFGRRGRLFDQIGPVVADDDDAAQSLVGAALSAGTDRRVAIDVFDSRRRLAAWLGAIGFRAERPLFRMRRRSEAEARMAPDPTHPGSSEFAIFGPEFG